jgi:hypothetical protein
MTLVHGTCRAGPLLWAHAWVELPGAPGGGETGGALVFCGVRQRFYAREGYARVLGTTAEATYRPEEAVARLRATQRYGPWHRGALGGASVRRLDPLNPLNLLDPLGAPDTAYALVMASGRDEGAS